MKTYLKVTKEKTNLIKLAKYLKPFFWGLMLAILLLSLQAVTNLKLPNYMSDIVNIGIQQNGIENAAPQAISENGFALMTTFMSDSEKELVMQYYTLVPKTDTNVDGKVYESLYPKAREKLYVLKATDAEAQATVDTAFGAATWTMIYVLRDMASQTGQSPSSSFAASVKDIDLSKLYNYLPMLSSIPVSYTHLTLPT